MIVELLLRTGLAMLVGVGLTTGLMLVFLILATLAHLIEWLTGVSGHLWVFIGGALSATAWLYDALTS